MKKELNNARGLVVVRSGIHLNSKLATVYLWVLVGVSLCKDLEYPVCTHDLCKCPWSAITVLLKYFNYKVKNCYCDNLVFLWESCVLLKLSYHPDLLFYCCPASVIHSEHGECLRPGSSNWYKLSLEDWKTVMLCW